MASDQNDHTAQRLRRRGNRLAVLLLAFATAAVGVGAWQLAESQSKDRRQLRTLFSSRATVASALLDSLFRAAVGQSQVVQQQLGTKPTPAALAAYAKQSSAVFTAIVAGDGSIIAASPGSPTTIDKRLLASAAGGRLLAVSDLTRVNGQPVVESAIRLPSKTAVSYLVSGSPAKFFSAFLSGSLKPLTPQKDQGDAYVLDGKGQVLGVSSASNPRHPPPPDPELVKAVATETSGLYTHAGVEHYFAATMQPGTNWHVAVSAPTSALYKPASGVSRWLPWVILGILGMALLAIGLLVRNSLLVGARLAAVNAELAASQERLRERAVELQRSNEELQRSNAELEQFAYVASHDLSAPLRAVAGFSQLLSARYKGKLDADADEFISHMQDGVGRMQRIIDDLLAYSRVDRSELEPKLVDLDAVLGEVLHSLGPDIAESGAKVSHDPLGAAYGDPGQLSQVLQNLVANGIKFTAAGVTPEVHVSTERDGDRVLVHVRDNGIGIDAAHAERIFKMFQRLHSNDDYPGTGIGLAIAEKIVGRHGGDIEVEPAPEGGTVFTFDISAEPPR